LFVSAWLRILYAFHAHSGECLFNIAGDDDGFGNKFDNLGYTYNPKRRSGYMDDGIGQVAASSKDPSDFTPVTCFKYN
jgi:hypothetical protein